MIEAELKARLRDPDTVRAALAKRTAPQRATYRDTYYDTAAEELDRSGRELRLRTVEADTVRHLLTFKEPAVDEASGSKPEYETTVGDPTIRSAWPLIGPPRDYPIVGGPCQCGGVRSNSAAGCSGRPPTLTATRDAWMTDPAARFADELRRLRQERGLTYRELAALAAQGKSYIWELEKGTKPPNAAIAANLDRALNAGGRLTAALRPPADDDVEAELEAIELSRRVIASDVSDGTLDRLERATDSMAMKYATTPPGELLPRVRRHLDYVSSLVDAHKTLTQHKRLLVVGAWLSLLRATLHVDLRQPGAADAYLETAAELAEQTGQREIAAWCLETKAWDSLTLGDYRQALRLSQHAQTIAPAGGSALVQATAQEGRAWARLGDRRETGKLLTRVESLAEHRTPPEHPEHHYQYDPAKAHSYVATTLAWAGDPAAETVARDVIAELRTAGARPRRIATARLDLSLALLAAKKPDEAASEAGLAIASGRIVPSSWWRAREVVDGVESSGIPEANDLHDLAESHRPATTS